MLTRNRGVVPWEAMVPTCPHARAGRVGKVIPVGRGAKCKRNSKGKGHGKESYINNTPEGLYQLHFIGNSKGRMARR